MSKRKQLAFDIDTNVAKEILGETNYTGVYAKIRDFMEKREWFHIEGSVYMSKMPMENANVAWLLDDLKEQFPYLVKCIRKMHQADISNVHSLENHFEYDGTAGEFARKEAETKQLPRRNKRKLR